MTRGGVIGTLAIVLTASSARAQTGTPPATPLPAINVEVVVTAERGATDRRRLAVSTDVVDGDVLAVRPVADLADAVQMISGFQVVGRDLGTPPATIARGFFGGGEAEYVKLLIDGVPINDVESGVAPWALIPAAAIERVEVTRGPSSALYGDSALAGVIQVFTPRRAGRSARVSANGGSFTTATASGFFQAPLASHTLQALGSYTRSDGFREHSRYEHGSLMASLRGGADRRWAVQTSFNALGRDEPGAITEDQLRSDRSRSNSIFRLDRESARRAHGSVRYSPVAGALSSNFIASVSGRSLDRRRTLLLAPGVGDRAIRDLASVSAGVSADNALAVASRNVAARLHFGGEGFHDRIDTDYRPVDDNGVIGPTTSAADAQRTRVAIFATQTVDLGDRLMVQGGLRWDRLRDASGTSERSHTAWSPRAGISVAAGYGVVLFAHAARAFKAPTLDQVFDPRPFPDFRGGTFRISNPSLQPQRASTIEGGVRQFTAHHRWEALVYYMTVRDEIDFDPATFTYANIGRSRHDGVELDAAFFHSAPVTAGVNYGWTRVTSSARQLKNIPRHLIRPHVTVRLPRTVTLHAQYTGTAGAYADDANRFRLGDRSTVDLRLAKTFSRATLRLDALNVTSDRYEEVGYVLTDFRGRQVPYYYPAPRLALRVGADVTF